jgi:NOL1/NOP2/fmu family ribosome biogenesis protein
MCARRQAEILNSGAQLLKPGGRLVYSTCTFAPEENEQAIENFLTNHPEFTREPVEAPWFTPAGEGAFRLWPHKLLGEGHFAAVLRKTGGDEGDPASLNGEKLPKEWESFAKELKIQLPAGKALMFGSSLYWVPTQMPDIRKIKVVRPGLELGELKKNRFEPAHALALWLKKCENIQDFPENSKEIRSFMEGQVVPGTCKGWCLVTVNGYSLGWGKGDGTVIKNHYPKGLRRNS